MKPQTTSLEFSHFPVMLKSIQISSPAKGRFFVDCTFGGGNYSQKLLQFPKTKVIGIDRDTAVTSIANKLVKKYQNRFKFYQIKFSQIDKILKNKVDTIIFDFGVSSIQLNNLKERIFFQIKRKIRYEHGSLRCICARSN